MSDKLKLRVKLDDILQKVSNLVTSWSSTPSDTKYPSEKLVKDTLDTKAPISHEHNSNISYGQVDSTSTSTVFTATVPNITSLVDGTTVMLRNGVITSAEGFTLNVNQLGAKPVYSNMADATRDTTIFNINYTMLFVYDSNRITDGCWICYRGYDSNTNTIGYQLRTNNTVFTTTDKGYRYRLWLQTDDGKLMPVNTSTSTNATANRSSYMNTRKFWIGGKIVYNSTKADYQANVTLPANTMWQQYNFALGYSFNNTGSALTLTSGQPLYMVATDEGDGYGKLASPYYTQTLPSSADGKLYIYLGHMTSATNMELALEHPIFEYKGNGIRLYRDCYTASEVDTLLNGKANSSHTHTKSQITDFPTIPSKTSDLTNDSNFLTSHQSLKTINGEPLVGSGDITITGGGGDDSEFLTGSFSGDSSYIIVANSSKSTINDGDRFYVHITNTSTGTSNARLSVGYGSGNYYANGVIYDNYTPIQSNQIIADTIILVECSIGNDYSWNVVEMWSYAPVNHTHSGYANSSHTHTVSNVYDVSTVNVVVTYIDDTTETLQLLSKITLGTTITISANPSTTIYTFPQTTISGILKDENNTPISNATISFKLNDSSQGNGGSYPTVTTNQNGEYTLSISGGSLQSVWYYRFVQGNNTLQAIFEGGGLYAPSDASVTIVGTGK